MCTHCNHRIINAVFAFLTLVSVCLNAAEPGYDQAVAALQTQRYREAARLLEPLADSGHAPSQVELGLLHYHGRGVVEDERKAFLLFSRAAVQGNLDAMYQLGNLYILGSGVPNDETDGDRKAAQWLFEAAVRGHASAQHSLGILFLTGKGVQQSNTEGLKWIGRAADQGNPDARRFLGGYSGKP
jgi:TPR repeat protein